jgi:hypothetical protein
MQVLVVVAPTVSVVLLRALKAATVEQAEFLHSMERHTVAVAVVH